MRELVLRIPLAVLNETLDRVLPLVPGGVREVPSGGSYLELQMRGAQLPTLSELAEALAPLPYAISERQVADDWRERRLAGYRAEPIAGRLVVRPIWAPAPEPGLIDISLSEGNAFGAGAHPTTRGCLELLLELPTAERFADLGCGSGVLSILAAHLGWATVAAFDVEPASVEAARENAARNGVSIEVRVADLTHDPPPSADGFAANMPTAVHLIVASRWRTAPPRIGLLSGFGPDEAPPVIDAYAACGLHERRRLERHGWVIAEVRQN
jgi:ribosomal protein L11 methyltransferase